MGIHLSRKKKKIGIHLAKFKLKYNGEEEGRATLQLMLSFVMRDNITRERERRKEKKKLVLLVPYDPMNHLLNCSI